MARYVVEVVSSDRCYGGAEEGGWWYNRMVVHFQKWTTKRIAKKMAKRLAAEVAADVSGEVALNIRGCETQLVQKAYRGRNKYSVLGGTDWEVNVTKMPTETTHRRPRYE